jgi:hypothetical protein
MKKPEVITTAIKRIDMDRSICAQYGINPEWPGGNSIASKYKLICQLQEEIETKIKAPILLAHYGHSWGKERAAEVCHELFNGEYRARE